jgi:hypothetical protein
MQYIYIYQEEDLHRMERSSLVFCNGEYQQHTLYNRNKTAVHLQTACSYFSSSLNSWILLEGTG